MPCMLTEEERRLLAAARAAQSHRDGATTARVGSAWCAVIPTFIVSVEPEDWRPATLCLHEAFHASQQTVWPQINNLGPWAEMSPIAAALCRVEAEALSRALDLGEGPGYRLCLR